MGKRISDAVRRLRTWCPFRDFETLRQSFVGKTTADINLLAPELFFLILAHPVYKMWIIQEPNTLELWNKLHFEEEK